MSRNNARQETPGGAKRTPEGTEGASGAPPGERRRGPGRISAKRKREAVLRLLRGEDLDTLARQLGVTAAKLSAWRDDFLAAGETALKARAPDARDDENARLKAKLADVTMDNELLQEKIDRLEAGRPFRRGRSRP